MSDILNDTIKKIKRRRLELSHADRSLFLYIWEGYETVHVTIDNSLPVIYRMMPVLEIEKVPKEMIRSIVINGKTLYENWD